MLYLLIVMYFYYVMCSFVSLSILIVMYRSFYSVSLCCSVYCFCVNVYCATATGCHPQLQLNIYHIISYHIISYHIISYHIISYHIISYHIISHHITSHHIISYQINVLFGYNLEFTGMTLLSGQRMYRTQHTVTVSGESRLLRHNTKIWG
jgi:hypothetical protein